MPPNHLVTYSESVSAFLLYPAPDCPGRDLPLGSYLSRRRLWGGRGTSRVRVPYPDAITMALKPPLPSLYRVPGLSGPWGLPTVSLPPWSFLPMGIGEPHCDCLASCPVCSGDALVGRRLHLGDALPSRRLALATLPLGDAGTWRPST